MEKLSVNGGEISMAKKAAKPTKKARRRKKLTLVLLFLVAVVYGFLAFLFYQYWCDKQVVFHDVTVELGTESLGIRDFMTEKAKPKRVSFVSDPSKIDLSKVGQTQLTLKHGSEEHTVTLTVQDTVAPTAVIETERTIAVTEDFPKASSLVSNVQDMSEVTIYYKQEPVLSDDYSPVSATVIVEDAAGNRLAQACTFAFTGWLKESVDLEMGTALTAQMLLQNPEKDSVYLDPAQLEAISASAGEQILTVNTGGAEASCTITVQDTAAPVLKLQNIRRRPGQSVELSDFISYVSDASGDPQVRLVGELPDCSVEGKHTIVIEAEDKDGNITKAEATLWVATNLNPPEIKGASQTITMKKNSPPDFLAGVYAVDDIDKNIEVTVDTSALDTGTAGTYYITYYAVDNSGNMGSYKRKVIVQSDAEDTKTLVAEIAGNLSSDPEAIRDYVHDTIAYSTSWGGEDPVWHGLTTNSGNCYVHALTLQALLNEKGYETQLIWVTNKSHYWVIVKLEEGWRHIDSTPSAQHEKIGLATDKVRYQNLNGRNWDRSKWPKCE